jgi:methionyl-tRNA formyltransferase
VAVVVPAARRPLALWSRRPLVRQARHQGIPVEVLSPADGPPLAGRLARLGAELLCVASFPFRLRPEILGAASRGGLNVHFSLLPRHRGPDPLFWTYFCDDAETGVSVHWLDEGADTGDLVAQERATLARGRPVRDLYDELTRKGAALLAASVVDLAQGVSGRRPQDAARATSEPAPRERTWSIDWSSWSAERLWHFLRGLGGLRHDLLRVPHGEATRFSLATHDRAPGTIERTGGTLRVYARDGIVELEPAPLPYRVRAALAGRRA